MNLGHVRAPDESGARERAWAVVSSVYAERPVHVRRRRPARVLLLPAALLIVASFALTPAGASVRHWIDRALGAAHPSRALFELPARGGLLVSGRGGAWVVREDGTRRRLGGWSDATWSPLGRYVAVVAPDELAAVDPHGAVRWSVARPAVRDPRWLPRTGYRIAYLSGSVLRVIAGDGTGDRALASHVLPIAPAWRPGHPYQLAYVTDAGRLVIRDGESGVVESERGLAAAPRMLEWSPDGARLVVLTGASALVFDGRGRPQEQIRIAAHDAAISPDGRAIALLGERDLTIAQLPPRAPAPRRLFSGESLGQVAWSPDGGWLLVSWPAANQWIFVRAGVRPRIEAVSRIAQQFGGAPLSIDGWCCA